ncbi:hypothetical protein ES707_12929 [subsurface metagenome]
MAERCRAVADLDVGVKVARFSATDGFDEIFRMRVAAARAARAFFAVLECDLPAFSTDGHGSFVAVEDIAVIVTFERIRRPQSHLVHQVDIVIFECCDLGIGRFVVVVVE